MARNDAYAALTLRLALGGMWVSHGLWKLWALGVPGLAGFMSAHGLPAWGAEPLILAEVAGGAAILAGLHGRWVSAALSPILVGALLIHWPNGLIFSVPGGGWEYPAFLLVASVVHGLLGDGAYAAAPALRPLWRLRSVG